MSDTSAARFAAAQAHLAAATAYEAAIAAELAEAATYSTLSDLIKIKACPVDLATAVKAHADCMRNLRLADQAAIAAADAADAADRRLHDSRYFHTAKNLLQSIRRGWETEHARKELHLAGYDDQQIKRQTGK